MEISNLFLVFLFVFFFIVFLEGGRWTRGEGGVCKVNNPLPEPHRKCEECRKCLLQPQHLGNGNQSFYQIMWGQYRISYKVSLKYTHGSRRSSGHTDRRTNLVNILLEL